ncbi:MMPL family transporter [Nonomuraea rosea]|uniref:MMPL family transporter n=1 Tax=Nonomuraea rosea TaxID=638574 RepID=A0ABP7A5J8_9ACTN
MTTARWSAHHPWRAIIGWIVFVVLCLGAGIALGSNQATTRDFRVGEAGRAETIAEQAGLQREPTDHILITARQGPLAASSARAAAADIVAAMRRLPEVNRVGAPVASRDGTALRVPVVLNGPELEGKKNVVPLLAQTEQIAAAYPGLRIEETGSPAISKGVNDQRDDDLALSEKITLPVTVITLLGVFGSIVMAAVPLVLALSSIAAALGLSMVASHLLPDAGVGTNMILLVGLAVGVDYTLFYLKRERDERAHAGGRLSGEALVELAAATAGRTIVTSGLAVIVSTATLYLASDVIFSSLATGTILVVAVAVASSLTVLPALLVKLGRRAERRTAKRAGHGRPRLPADRRTDAHEPGRLLGRLLRPAQRHPVGTLVASVLLMLGLATPALSINLIDPGRDTFSRDIPAMQSYDRLTAAYPEVLVKHEVVVRSSAKQAAQVRQGLIDLAGRSQSDPLFASTAASNTTNADTALATATGVTDRPAEPIIRISADRRTAVLELAVPHPAQDAKAVASLRHLRENYIPATVGKIGGTEIAVSGDVARGQDYVQHESGTLPLVIGALLLLTFLMTLLVYRSWVIALLGVLLNLLSAGAALGALVVVFQGTWAEGLLGFESLGAIASRVPLFLFVILFGLSMDYQFFVISRIKEAMDHGMPARQAAVEGIGRSAQVVTSAAVVMVTVFAAFVFLHLTEMKQMGFCLALAVLLDAFVIRLLILPAALRLLGERAWPGRRGPAAGGGAHPATVVPFAETVR